LLDSLLQEINNNNAFKLMLASHSPHSIKDVLFVSSNYHENSRSPTYKIVPHHANHYANPVCADICLPDEEL